MSEAQTGTLEFTWSIIKSDLGPAVQATCNRAMMCVGTSVGIFFSTDIDAKKDKLQLTWRHIQGSEPKTLTDEDRANKEIDILFMLQDKWAEMRTKKKSCGMHLYTEGCPLCKAIEVSDEQIKRGERVVCKTHNLIHKPDTNCLLCPDEREIA